MKRLIIALLLFSLLLQIGCSSITQIQYPVDENKSESDVRSLNYFGERLTSTITLTDSFKVEAYWLHMKDDKIYFLTEGLDDTTSVAISKIKTVRFYDLYGGCLRGGLLGLGILSLSALAFGSGGSKTSHGDLSGFFVIVSFVAVPIASGIIGALIFGQREFNFVQTSQ